MYAKQFNLNKTNISKVRFFVLITNQKTCLKMFWFERIFAKLIKPLSYNLYMYSK